MTIEQLYQIICSRKNASTGDSYTAYLLAKGSDSIAQKLGEECVELVIEAVRLSGTAEDAKDSKSKDLFVGEAADLMYHYLVLLASCGVSLDDVFAELTKREGQSGLAEKLSRNHHSGQ